MLSTVQEQISPRQKTVTKSEGHYAIRPDPMLIKCIRMERRCFSREEKQETGKDQEELLVLMGTLFWSNLEVRCTGVIDAMS